jgi:hypothetical protein
VTIGKAVDVGDRLESRAFSRFCHVAGAVSIGAGIFGVIGYEQSRPALHVWPALIPLAVILALLVTLDLKPTRLLSAVYLVGGGIAMYAYSRVLFEQLPQAHSTDTFFVSFPQTALILLGGASLRIRGAMLWCIAGFVVVESATVLAAAHVGATIRFDVASALSLLGVLFALAFIEVNRRRMLRARPVLRNAALDERVAEVRYEMEVKAAALMHDTVLNHLAVVAGADSGRIDPALRSAIERDVQLLLSDEWLTDDATAGIEDLGTVWIESELFVVIQEARADGMLIDVSGDLDAIGRLDPARSAAVALAARQSLVNVMSHANTDRAEVVVLGADGAVSVMVIDGGSGFDPDDVAPDRLGIRQSIRARIETVGGEVEVWSTKGRGTSVLIRVPERTDESARRNSASRDSAIGDSVG